MSEYWKSTPKYWCKHCSTYVKDTPFERKQHESTGKHLGNLKRFLRTIQNDHERNERDKQRAKDEVERLNRVVGSGGTSTSPPSLASTTSNLRQSVPITRTAADQKRQWAQLSEMGIAVPEEYRSDMAMAGDWRVVSQRLTSESTSDDPLSVGIRKRKYEGQEEEEEAGETVVRKGWGSTTRRYPGQDEGDLDDLLSGKLPLKKEPSAVNSISPNPKKEPTETTDETADLVKVGPRENSASADETATEAPAGAMVKTGMKEEDKTTRLEDVAEATAMPIFKKRRAKATVS